MLKKILLVLKIFKSQIKLLLKIKISFIVIKKIIKNKINKNQKMKMKVIILICKMNRKLKKELKRIKIIKVDLLLRDKYKLKILKL